MSFGLHEGGTRGDDVQSTELDPAEKTARYFRQQMR